MTRRRAAAIAGTLAAIMLLSGCQRGGASVDEELSVEDAKATTQATELEIAGLVPAEVVARVSQRPDGVLVQCPGQNAYQWTGRTRVMLTGEPDSAAIVAAIADEFAAREGYSSELTTAASGEPRAHITGASSSGFVVDAWDGGTRIDISSFSSCFRLTDEDWPGDTF